MHRIGVIGGGINGLFISWQLSLRGFEVDLFESRNALQRPHWLIKLLNGSKYLLLETSNMLRV